MRKFVTILFVTFSYYLSAQVYIKDSTAVINTSLQKTDKALHFIVMGDWGRNGEDHQKEVAVQMGKTASEIKAQFIIASI